MNSPIYIRGLRQTCLSKPIGCRYIRCKREIIQRFDLVRILNAQIFEANLEEVNPFVCTHITNSHICKETPPIPLYQKKGLPF